MALPVLMIFEQEEGTEVSLLALRGNLPGAVDTRIYSAASLSVMRCYGFDSKIYLDE